MSSGRLVEIDAIAARQVSVGPEYFVPRQRIMKWPMTKTDFKRIEEYIDENLVG